MQNPLTPFLKTCVARVCRIISIKGVYILIKTYGRGGSHRVLVFSLGDGVEKADILWDRYILH